MNTTDQVQYHAADILPRQATAWPALAPSRHQLAAPVRCSIFRTRTDLIGAQRVDGSWAARNGLDAVSSALLVLLDAYLGRAPSVVAERAVATLLRAQQPAGGWSRDRGCGFDLDQSVLAYFALKLSGESACRPELARARQVIRTHGGADGCSAATRIWLALFGQIDYEICPPIPPEWLMMPGSTENLSTSDLCLLAARSAIWALRPTREICISSGIRELFIESPSNWPASDGPGASLPFPSFTSFWRGCERIGWLPFRRSALERADFLLTEATLETSAEDIRCDELVWRRVALDALGHSKSSRVVVACQRLLEQFAEGEPDEARSRPHTSLTSDTVLALEALRASGLGEDDDPIAVATNWLVSHRLNPARRLEHFSEIAALVQACGCLEESDDSQTSALPPDIKLAGRQRKLNARQEPRPFIELGRFTDHLLGRAIWWQRSDGGWGLDENLDRCRRTQGILGAGVRRSPAASDAATTGRMLELMSRLPRAGNRTSIAHGVAFLRSSQRGDGSWATSDGNPSLTATAWAVRGLIAAGAEPSNPAVAAGVNWLLVHQLYSGGWGAADKQPHAEEGAHATEGTIVETAMAVLALVRAGSADDEATRRAIGMLVNLEADEHDLHASAWKLIALSQWQVAVARLGDADQPATLRLVCGDTTP